MSCTQSGSTATITVSSGGGDSITVGGTAATDPDFLEGLALDLTLATAPTPDTITWAFDPTELTGSRTWGDTSTNTIVWTWDRNTGTDPTLTFGSGDIETNGNFTLNAANANLSLSATGTDTYGFHIEAGGIGYLKNETDNAIIAEMEGTDVLNFGNQNVPFMRFRTDGSGGGEIILPNNSIGANEVAEDAVLQTASFTQESPVDADRALLMRASQALTVLRIGCIIDPADAGESVVIALYESDASGDFTDLATNGLDGNKTITCDNDGALDDEVLSNSSIASGAWVGIDVGAVTGTVSRLTVTWTYRLDVL